MSIESLILGKLHQPAEQRTSKAGRPFVTATVRAAVGEAEGVFVKVLAFSESAGAALLALHAGDALAVAGTLKPAAWIDREGNARPSLDLVAAQVLTLYGLKKKRAASAGAAPAEPGESAPPMGEDFSDDGWLTGGTA